MRINQVLLAVTAATCCVCATSVGSTGPDDRQLTDPASVVSASDPAARPAPIEDLYYTRNVFGAAWSPDGSQIVFTSDISGRFNLWKVRASGGWPIQTGVPTSAFSRRAALPWLTATSTVPVLETRLTRDPGSASA